MKSMKMMQQQQMRPPKPPKPLRSPIRLPLDFAKVIANRCANRVAENTCMQDNNDYFYNLQRAVEAENQFNERHRLEDRLRVGGLPSHITRPIYESPLKNAKVPPEARPKAQPKSM
jgi:hypothetical protein